MIYDDEDLLEDIDFDEDDELEEGEEKAVEGAWYPAKDIGCHCTDGGTESQWEWDGGQACYVCTACGDMQ